MARTRIPRKDGRGVTGLDYLIGSYVRSPGMATCIDLLVAAGGTTKYDLPKVLATIRSDSERLAAALNADPKLVHRRFAELECGSTGARRLLLTGATLLHVAAEFGAMEAARLLLSRGADVNAHGGSGQSPIFHSVTQYGDAGLAMAQLLLENGADLTVRTTLPGHYDRPDDFPECTPLAMQCFSRAMNFPGRMRRRLNC
jgi:hypothetical protein